MCSLKKRITNLLCTRKDSLPVVVSATVDVPVLVQADRLAGQVLLADAAGEAGGVVAELTHPQALPLDLLTTLLTVLRLLLYKHNELILKLVFAVMYTIYCFIPKKCKQKYRACTVRKVWADVTICD